MIIEKNMSDDAVSSELGSRISRVRLNKNITQKDLAKEAGVSLPTVQRIERGDSSNVTNLIRVLRALGLLGNFNALVPQYPVSPMMQIKAQGRVRVRASVAGKEDGKGKGKVDALWTWGE